MVLSLQSNLRPLVLRHAERHGLKPQVTAKSGTVFVAAALLSFTFACDAPAGATLPAPSYEQFRTEAYPVILRDCGFSTCHGSADRFFHVYGPGRLRLDPEETLMLDPVTEDELEASYERVRAMLVHDSALEQSPLLSKPLEGAGHGGVDTFGRNVYASTSDINYIVLQSWASTTENTR